MVQEHGKKACVRHFVHLSSIRTTNNEKNERNVYSASNLTLIEFIRFHLLFNNFWARHVYSNARQSQIASSQSIH